MYKMAQPQSTATKRSAGSRVGKYMITCLLGLAVSACNETVSAATPDCRIDQQASGSTITLIGAVITDVSLSGRYRLEVTTHSTGGTSRVVQQGMFEAQPDHPEPLGRVMTRVGAGGRVSAELSVTAADGTICLASL
jgi:hypothetical protein